MKCLHCNKDLELNYESPDHAIKLFTCVTCDKWFEMRKQKALLNAAVPVAFLEIENPEVVVRKAA